MSLTINYFANSANCLGSDRSTPGIPSRGIFLIPVTYSLILSWEWDEDDSSSSILAVTISSVDNQTHKPLITQILINKRVKAYTPSSVPVAHIVTLNSPSNVLIWTCFCSHFLADEPPPDLCEGCSKVVPLCVDLLFLLFVPELDREEPIFRFKIQ